MRKDSLRPSVRKDGSTSRRLPVDNLRPTSVWTQDDNRHTLFIDLPPGFQKEDVKIQVGEAKSMTVSGERRDDKKIQRFKETYPIPDDYESMDWTMDNGKLHIHFHKKKSEITTVENDPSPILESEVHEEGNKKDEAHTEITSATGVEDDNLKETTPPENTGESPACTAFREEILREITEIKTAMAMARNGYYRDGSKKGSHLESDYTPKEEGFLKCLWCRVKKKKDLIAAAVMAFAVGWYMSQRKHPPSGKLGNLGLESSCSKDNVWR